MKTLNYKKKYTGLVKNLLFILFLISYYLLSKLLIKNNNYEPKHKVVFVKTDAVGYFFIWYQNFEHYLNNDMLVIVNEQNYLTAIYLGISPNNLLIFTNNLISNPKELLKFCKKIIHSNSHVCVNACSGRSFWPSDIITYLLKSNYKIGSKYTGRNRTFLSNSITNIIYDHIERDGTKDSSPLGKTHNSIIAKIKDRTPFDRKVNAQPQPIKTINSLKPSISLAIIPGASKSFRRWSPEKFSELIFRLENAVHIQNIYLVGSSDEVSISQIIAQKLDGLNIKVSDTTGKLKTKDYLDLIRGSDIVVTNETSAAHIGPYFKIPTFILLGGGHFGKFVPIETKALENRSSFPVYNQMDCFNCNWSCKYEKNYNTSVPCIENIEVDQLYLEMINYLKIFFPNATK